MSATHCRSVLPTPAFQAISHSTQALEAAQNLGSEGIAGVVAFVLGFAIVAFFVAFFDAAIDGVIEGKQPSASPHTRTAVALLNPLTRQTYHPERTSRPARDPEVLRGISGGVDTQFLGLL